MNDVFMERAALEPDASDPPITAFPLETASASLSIPPSPPPSPMRIGYLVPDWPGQTHAFFWREMSAMRARGHMLFPLSTRRPPLESCRHAFAASARRQTCYLHPPGPAALAMLLRSAGALAAVRRYVAGLGESGLAGKLRVLALLGSAAHLAAHARAQGIVHVHGHSCANSAHLLAMASLLGGFSYSLTLHGDLPVYGRDHASKFRRAAFVAAVTRPLQGQLRQVEGRAATRVPLVWMGVDTRQFRPPHSRPDRAGRLHLATVARLNHTKGHRFAIEAMGRARALGLDLHYSIAGEGPERAAIEECAAGLGLERHISFLGNLSEAEVLQLLHRADAFILPSFGLGEAAPVSVMEAMACALPVISSRIGGVGDMIDHGVNGLLTPQQDVSALTAAIARLAAYPEYRKQIGRAAREQAVRAFDHRIMADRLLGEIAASLNQKHPSP